MGDQVKINYTIALHPLPKGWAVSVCLPDDNTLLGNVVHDSPDKAVFYGCTLLMEHIKQYPNGKPSPSPKEQICSYGKDPYEY